MEKQESEVLSKALSEDLIKRNNKPRRRHSIAKRSRKCKPYINYRYIFTLIKYIICSYIGVCD